MNADEIKNKLVNTLNDILDNELDDALQGNYDKREDIMSEFENIIERIKNYKNN